MRRFYDRLAAGKELGERLLAEKIEPRSLVLALPRGGVPVGFEVASVLGADLDVVLVRKLGVPRYEELAMGAIASGGIVLINAAVVNSLQISATDLNRAIARERAELQRREYYREGRPAAKMDGRTVILTDDGLATGVTMLAAVRAVQLQHPKRIIVAVPVASPEACQDVRDAVHQTICLATPEPFYSVADSYEDFTQVSDAKVKELLRAGAREVAR